MVITHNERANIRDCLASLSFAAEMIVVDALSTDGTPEAARQLGAQVVDRAWDGYARQRQAGFDQATSEWVLWLDADERVTPELAEEIQTSLATPGAPAAVDGYLMPRRHYFLGDWLRWGGEYPAYQLRLVRRSHALMRVDLVHETIESSGLSLGRFQGSIDHFSSPSLRARLDKARRYSKLSAEQAVASGAAAAYRRHLVVTRPIGRFVHLYLRLRGYRDGWRGAVFALTAAYEQALLGRQILRLRGARG